MIDRAVSEKRFRDLTLLVPDKADPERDAVCDAWQAGGGTVERLGKFWEPPPIDPERARIYGPDTFALVLAQKLNLELISPADDLLARAPTALLQRDLRVISLSAVKNETFPRFVKPLVPK